MLQNITISIYKFEAEDIHKFTADIKKLSAAVAEALNANPEALKIIYKYVNEGGSLPYGASVWAGLPSFEGGCGVGCFRSIFEACGYEWRQGGSGELFNCYTIERRGDNE